MKPRLDPAADSTSIGSILVAMAAVGPDDLASAIEKQLDASMHHKIGALLVHAGYCTTQDVVQALAAQEALRSRSRTRQALGTVDIARARKRALTKQRARLVSRSHAVTRKATRQDHPIVCRSTARQSGQTPAR